MDSVSLIVTALVAGAGAAGAGAVEGVTEATKEAVVGLYERLKAALSGKADAEPAAVRMLERHAGDPVGYEAPVRDLVMDSGADQDATVVALAEQLLAAVEGAGAGAGAATTTMLATAKDHARVYQAGRDQHINEK